MALPQTPLLTSFNQAVCTTKTPEENVAAVCTALQSSSEFSEAVQRVQGGFEQSVGPMLGDEIAEALVNLLKPQDGEGPVFETP